MPGIANQVSCKDAKEPKRATFQRPDRLIRRPVEGTEFGLNFRA